MQCIQCGLYSLGCGPCKLG